MTCFQDLKPGLYRARWLGSRYVRNYVFGFVLHRFAVVGEGEVEIPDPFIRTLAEIALETDCNAQLMLDVAPIVPRSQRSPEQHYSLRRVTVKVLA